VLGIYLTKWSSMSIDKFFFQETSDFPEDCMKCPQDGDEKCRTENNNTISNRITV
jgi:hypothetical protein